VRKSVYVSIIVVSVILGLMVTMLIRTTGTPETGAHFGREQELTIEKRLLEKNNELLKALAAELQEDIDEAGRALNEAETARNSEYHRIKNQAGFTDLAGQGIMVTVDDHEAEDPAHGGNIITDTDLLKIVNDLRGADAEAIAINGQRILATSEIREVGRHINVNLVRLAPPYHIVAIGNSSALRNSLEIKYGICEDLRERGVEVGVVETEWVVVPAFSGNLRFEYAKQAQGGG